MFDPQVGTRAYKTDKPRAISPNPFRTTVNAQLQLFVVENTRTITAHANQIFGSTSTLKRVVTYV
jgi:hypothetical protein